MTFSRVSVLGATHSQQLTRTTSTTSSTRRGSGKPMKGRQRRRGVRARARTRAIFVGKTLPMAQVRPGQQSRGGEIVNL